MVVSAFTWPPMASLSRARSPAERVAVLSEGGLQEVACAPTMGPELEARLRRSYGAALRYTTGELFDWIEERG